MDGVRRVECDLCMFRQRSVYLTSKNMRPARRIMKCTAHSQDIRELPNVRCDGKHTHARGTRPRRVPKRFSTAVRVWNQTAFDR